MAKAPTTPNAPAAEEPQRAQSLLERLDAEQAAETGGAPPPEPPAEPAPVAETPEPAPVAETPAPEPERPSIISILQQRGFEGVDNEEAALERVGQFFDDQQRQQQAYQQQQQEMQRRLSEQMAMIELLREQRQQPAPPAQPQPGRAEPPKGWLNLPPAPSQALLNEYLVQTDEGVDWKPNTPAALRMQAEERMVAARQFVAEFASDPQAALQPFADYMQQTIEHRVMEQVGQLLDQRQQHVSAESFQDRFERENGELLYRRDPRSGQLRPGDWSDSGAEIMDLAQAFHAEGMGQEAAWQRAVEFYRLRNPAAQPQQQQQQPAAVAPTPAQAAEAAKASFLQRNNGAALPDRGGTRPSPNNPQPAPPQDRAASPGQRVLERLQQGVA